MTDLHLPVDAFVRAFGVNKGVAHAVFLGAGASISSGVPSAARCIWEWKRDIFITNHPGLEEQFAEISLPSVRERIQRWLDAQRQYPQDGGAEEYGHYIERCYPVSEDRRLYFQQKIREAEPHVGYKALCALAEAGYIQAVWSTNFDGLSARTAASFRLTPIEVGIDCKTRLPRPIAKSELLCVSLHGDYRYDSLKNTQAELQEQDAELRRALVEYGASHPLVVCGYSGRDESIMRALQESLAGKGTGSIFWCGFGEDIPPNVADLLSAARENGRRAHYVATQGFDDLLVRLALHSLEGETLQRTKVMLAEAVEEREAACAAFAVPEAPIGSVLRSNAFEVQCPSEVLEFDMTEWPAEKVWSWFREFTEGSDVLAVPYRKKVVALGTLDDVRTKFAGRLKGTIERTPVGEGDLRYEDGALVSLFRSALAQGIARLRGTRTDGRSLIWDEHPSEERTFEHKRYPVHAAALLSLRSIARRQYLIVKPTIVISDNSPEVPREVVEGVKRAVFGWQHNAKFHAATERWRKRIFGESKDETLQVEWPPECGSTFRFEVRRNPVFARIAAPEHRPALRLEPKVERHLQQRGLELREPKLVFGDRQGRGLVRDTHPIRGILRNRPYDFSLTQRGLMTGVRLGVVCPALESRALSTFLSGVHSQHRPSTTEQDYLLDYPGFANAFGVPIEVPAPGGPGWEVYAEPEAAAGSLEGGLGLRRAVIRAIEALRAGHAPNVILVLTPERFDGWRNVETETESFDLHDSVKAYCAPRGVATQFLREDTFQDTQDCRVYWWLALALYAKSMRTPWLLDGLDGETAFVGLGFSVDRHAQPGRHVVLGCSHIYSSRGEGLQYRLAKIENAVFRGRNPFMSLEDARQVGEMVRQLFYESRLKLPSRVVIHKQTPFWRDEKIGLLQGLGGVSEVEMLEVNIDSSLRYVSSRANGQGGLAPDAFPVERGTIVVTEPHTALLWVHGVTAAVDDKRRYYQGKRRIPAPLVVKRHLGNSDIATLGSEILGLSKMDWNTFDLYTKLPATIKSSACIARIGSRLERFGPTPFDYRLFI